MFYRNISRYINKLCGWWQRLVVTARLQCLTFNNPNCDERKREREEREKKREREREKKKKKEEDYFLCPHQHFPENAKKDSL
jgi:hypothetical protein